MVDVTKKDVTERSATATGLVRMSPSTRDLVISRSLEKGDALEVARVAGIMGAKRTSDLIPLCHLIALGAVALEFAAEDAGISVTAKVKTTERTGVEMEALTAVTVAALTIYDMVKGTERGASIEGVRLVHKAGGRTGEWSSP
jgi:cyclic pyranopterin monophosphate synthase